MESGTSWAEYAVNANTTFGKRFFERQQDSDLTEHSELPPFAQWIWRVP
jgi:hypothetical protein